jgi:hypothetical protein
MFIKLCPLLSGVAFLCCYSEMSEYLLLEMGWHQECGIVAHLDLLMPELWLNLEYGLKKIAISRFFSLHSIFIRVEFVLRVTEVALNSLKLT